MTPESLRETAFFLSNLGIFGGYLFVAFVVVPSMQVELVQTKAGGFFFFLTCGLTHLELAIHSYVRGGLDLANLLSWHMLTIHCVQVIAVWLFVWGLYQEFVKPQLPAAENGEED